MSAGTWTLVCVPNALSGERFIEVHDEGVTLESVLAKMPFVRFTEGHVRVLVDNAAVLSDQWKEVKPKAGQIVTAKSVPAPPIIAIIAAYAANAAVLATIGSGLGGALGIATLAEVVGTIVGLTVSTALTVGLSYGIGMAVSSISGSPEPRKPFSAVGPAQSPSARGVGNFVDKFGKIARGYGKMRVYPRIAAPAYTDVIGLEKWWRILLCVGRGRYFVDHSKVPGGDGKSGIQVGGVAIEDIAGAEFEIVEGGLAGSYEDEVMDTEPIDDSPVCYWVLDDAVGSGTALNRVGGAPVLTQHGGVTFRQSGILASVGGYSAKLDGIDDYLDVTGGSVPLPDLTGDWTVELWASQPLPVSGTDTLFWVGDSSNGIGLQSLNGVVQLVIPGAAAPYPTTFLLYGKSAYLAVRKTGAKIELFVNGVVTVMNYDGVQPIAPSARFSVGARYNGSTYDQFFLGSVSQVAVYDQSLSTDEITRRWDQGAKGRVTRGPFIRLLRDSVHEQAPEAIYAVPDFNTPQNTLGLYTTREIPGEIDEISVDFFFASGVYRINEGGKARYASVGIHIQYRATDTAVWADAVLNSSFIGYGWGVNILGNLVSVGGVDVPSQLLTFSWKVPRGRYEVRVTDYTLDPPHNRPGGNDCSLFAGNFTYLSLRGVTLGEQPFRAEGCCLVAVSLPAKETGATVGQISVLREAMLRTWDPADPLADPDTGWTPERVTANAAWAALDILCAPNSWNPRPLRDARIRLSAFKDFATRAKECHLEFDFATNVGAAVQLVLGTSLAGIGHDGLWTVIEERLGLVPVQLFTEANMSNVRGRKLFGQLEQATRVSILNAENGWQEDEVLVFDDFYSERGEVPGTVEADRYQSLDARGITSVTEAIANTKMRMRMARLRPEEWTGEAFRENLMCVRGDLVRLQVPSALIGQRGGSIVKVYRDGNEAVTAVDVSDPAVYEDGKLYGIRWRNTRSNIQYTATVTNPGASVNIRIQFDTPIQVNGPSVGDLFAFGERQYETVDALIRSIRRRPGLSAELTFIPYSPEVFNPVDEPAVYHPIVHYPTAAPELRSPAAPKILSIISDESVLLITPLGFTVRMRVIVIPTRSTRGPQAFFQVRIRLYGSMGNTGWIYGDWTDSIPGSLYFEVAEGATYEVQAHAATYLGVTSDWTPTLNHTVTGTSTPPPEPTDVRVEGPYIVWSYNAAGVPDLAGFQLSYMKGQKLTIPVDNFTPMHSGVWSSSPFPVDKVPHGQNVTVALVAVDLSGNKSTAAHLLFKNRLTPRNIIEELPQHPLWVGTKFNGSVVGGELLATMSSGSDSQSMWADDDTVAMWAEDDTALFWSARSDLMQYTFGFIPGAMEQHKMLNMTHTHYPPSAAVGQSYRVLGDTVPMWSDSDTVPLWDADDAVSMWDADWSDWRSWPGQITDPERVPFEFRVTVFPSSRVQNKLLTLDLWSDIDDLIEQLNNVFISNAGTRLPLTKAFSLIKYGGVSLISQTGQILVIEDYESYGPLIRAKNPSTGNYTSDIVDAEVRGVPQT